MAGPSTALSRVFSCLGGTKGPYLVTVSRFRRVAGCTSSPGVRTTLQARVRHYSGTRFIFSKSRERLVKTVFASPTHPFCRSIALVGLPPVSISGCTRFYLERFRQTDGRLSALIMARLCRHFGNVASCVRGIVGVLFSVAKAKRVYVPSVVSATVGSLLSFSTSACSTLLCRVPRGRHVIFVTVTTRKGTGTVSDNSFMHGCGLRSTDSISSTMGKLLRGSFVACSGNVCRMCSRFFRL